MSAIRLVESPGAYGGTDVARRFLSVSEVAQYCAVPNAEVLSWIDAGMLSAKYMSVGNYRVTVAGMLVFLNKFDIEI